MTDEQRAGLAPMSLDERIVYVRESVARLDADYILTDSFAAKLAAMSMGQHLSELEAQVKERDEQREAQP